MKPIHPPGILVLLTSLLSTISSQRTSAAAAAVAGRYSSMIIEKESGDFVGYDVRVFAAGGAYRIVLYCSEGGLVGPIKEDFSVINDAAVLHPKNTDCGKTIELRFAPKGIFITTEYITRELIPRHGNYLKEERWR